MSFNKKLFAMFVLNNLDIIFTIYGVHILKLTEEINPLMKNLVNNYPVEAVVYKNALMIFLIIVLHLGHKLLDVRDFCNKTANFVLLVFSMVCTWHIFLLTTLLFT